MKIVRFLLVSFALILISCNEDDPVQTCQPTSIIIKVNGEQINNSYIAQSLDLTADGYKLSLGFGESTSGPNAIQQNISITLPYKKKGENVFERFIYQRYLDGVEFEADLVGGNFENEVLSNNRSCFSCTFSGSVMNGDEEIIIEGSVSVEYEEPYEI